MAFGLLRAQDNVNLNLDVEGKPGAALPAPWIKWGNFELTLDTLATHGNTSGKLVSRPGEPGFGSLAYPIKANYAGTTITLTGYIKTQDAVDRAGLLLRIDGEAGTLQFSNMQNQPVSGTHDWQQYSVTLPYSEEAERIYVGGILIGEGTAWFDHFEVSIDGEDLQTKAGVPPKVYPADQDNAFDDGSGIDFPELTPALVDDLTLLGRVWGFVKYHHPTVAAGELQWDYALFRVLPDFLAARSRVQRESVLAEWVGNIGPVPPCESCASPNPNAVRTASQEWMSELDNTELKNALRHIYTNRNPGQYYYIGMAPGVGNPQFRHERAYADLHLPDAGFRLLALYRYWNMIEYFFPYVEETDEDWRAVLPEYIPRMLAADDRLAYERAMLELIGEVADTHANLWGGRDSIEARRGDYVAAVHLQFLDDKPVVVDYYDDSLREATGLEVGDIITQVDGRPVADIVRSVSKYYPASNEPTRLRDIAPDLLRSTKESLQVEVDRAGKTLDLTVPLYPSNSLKRYRWYPPRTKPSYERMGNIGYVTLQNIQEADIERIKADFRDTEGIIIDIRNYPSFFVPFALGSYFVTEETPFVKFTTGSVANPGEFTFGKPLSVRLGGGEPYGGKLVVLVNEYSQSQAEYTALALRAGHDVTIVGSTTAGADGNISQIALPGGLRTVISGIGVFYPDGSPTQRVGIVPDVEVRPTPEGIRAGRDEVLERAVELIEGS